MAISVKLFTSDLDCPEPAYQLPVEYSSISGADLCDGNGIVTNIFGDFSSLQDIYTNFQTGDASNAPNEDVCLDGMDVIFLLDYTSSMSGAINGVKSGIANIVTEIQTQSNGDYRLGLVLFDGGNSSSPRYDSSGYYQDLPADQKINEPNTGPSGGRNFITCVEKMDQIGNNTSFTSNLNSIDGSTNSDAAMILGSSTECGGLACYEVIQNDFAGIFRQDALKVIILITDDDSENAVDFTNDLIPAAEAAQIQLFLCTDNSSGMQPRYEDLVTGINPQGTAYYELVYNSTWAQSTVVTGLQELCESTVTYTCDPAAVGWYGEYPVGAGDTVYYWDGSSWTNTYQCPLEVRLKIVDNTTGATPDDIGIAHPYYYSSDTYSFSGAPGDIFTVTHTVTADSGYTNVSIGGISFSETSPPMPGTYSIGDDGGVVIGNISNTPSATTEQVDFQIKLPTNATCCGIYEWEASIKGGASLIQRTIQLDVINQIVDTTDAGGGAQPTGFLVPTGSTPAAGWQNMGIVYQQASTGYTFTGTPGTVFTFEVDFTPSPADYTLSGISFSPIQYSSATVQAGFNNTTLTDGSVSGTFTMPSVDGSVRMYLDGQCNRNEYNFTIDGIENITGAHVIPAHVQQTLTGYTGETINFTIDLDPDAGYSSYNISSAAESAPIGGGPSYISNLNVHPSGQYVTGTLTMPQGGGATAIFCSGTATLTTYSYTINVVSNHFSLASWPSTIVTGTAGQALSGTITALTTSGYNWLITGIQSNDASLSGTALNQGSGDPDVVYNLTMPNGGGSGTLTVIGKEAGNLYTFTVRTTEPYTLGTYDGQISKFSQWVTNTYTCTFGTPKFATINFNPANNYSYTASTSVSGTNAQALSVNSISGLPLDADLNIEINTPINGGTADITVTGTESPVYYNFDLTVDNPIPNSDLYIDGVLVSSGATKTYSGLYNQQTAVTVKVLPNPSTYNITLNQSTTGFTGTDAASIGAITYTANRDLDFVITHPARSGSATLTIQGTAVNPTYKFQLQIGTSISNTTVSQTTDQFVGVQGASHTFGPYLVSPATDYTCSVTSVSKSGSGQFSINAYNSGNNIYAGLTNPAQASSATITANGTSSQRQYSATINFYNDCVKQNHNPHHDFDWDIASKVYTGPVGSQHTDTRTMINSASNASNYEFTALNEQWSGTHISPYITNTSINYLSNTEIEYTYTFTMPSESTGHNGTFSGYLCADPVLQARQTSWDIDIIDNANNGISLLSANNSNITDSRSYTGQIGTSYSDTAQIFADTQTYDFTYTISYSGQYITGPNAGVYDRVRGYALVSWSQSFFSNDRSGSIQINATPSIWDFTFSLYNGTGGHPITPRILYWNWVECGGDCPTERVLNYTGNPAIGTGGYNMTKNHFQITDRSGHGTTWIEIDQNGNQNPTNTSTCLTPYFNNTGANRSVAIEGIHPLSQIATQNPLGAVVNDLHYVTQLAKPEINWVNNTLNFSTVYAQNTNEYFTQAGSITIAPSIDISNLIVIDTGDGTSWLTVTNPYGFGNGNQSHAPAGNTGYDGYFNFAVSQITNKARSCEVWIYHPLQSGNPGITDCNNENQDVVKSVIVVSQGTATTQPPCYTWEVNSPRFSFEATYTDCTTGLQKSYRSTLGGTVYICSSTQPVITNGQATVAAALDDQCGPGGPGVGNPHGDVRTTTTTTTQPPDDGDPIDEIREPAPR
jgi:hypothetical protein